MDLVFPSDQFPPPLALRLTVPDEWEPFAQPDAVVAASDTESPDSFTTNVLVTLTRVLGEVTLDALVEAQVQNVTVGLGGDLVAQHREDVAGQPAIWSAFTFQSTDLPVPVFQAQVALLVARTEGASDLITVVATCHAELVDHYADPFRATFLSLALAG